MKEELKGFLAELGHRVRDFGTNSTEAVDYPDFAHAVARAVSEGEADLGIVIDGAGVGSAMTANKVPGVRAAACYSVKVARNSREHNDANVLTLGSGTDHLRRDARHRPRLALHRDHAKTATSAASPRSTPSSVSTEIDDLND